MTNTLELLVRRVARSLHENQVARLYKIPNDIKMVDGKVLHAEQTPADFMGFTINGRVIILECKMRDNPSLELSKKILKPHQVIAINEVHQAGGIGLLVWQRGDRIAVIDAGQVKTYSEGRKSIPWSAIPDKYKNRPTIDPRRFFWPFF
jgi:penicillin-binding protein-related factor A (putative recombinase)